MRVASDAREFEGNAAAILKGLFPKHDWRVGLFDDGQRVIVQCIPPGWKDRCVRGRQNSGPPEVFMDMAAALANEFDNLFSGVTNAKA